MDIFIKCEVLSAAGKQVDFCSFRIYCFRISQLIAICDHRYTFIKNCRDIILTRILRINLRFFYSECTITTHRVFAIRGYFSAAFDQNIALCPYGSIRSRSAFYLAAVDRQRSFRIQSRIIACCFNLGIDDFNFACAVFIAHINCVKLIRT